MAVVVGGVTLQERRGGGQQKEKNGGGNTEVSKPSVTSDHPPLPQLSPRSGGGCCPSQRACVRGHGAPGPIVCNRHRKGLPGKG